jgi:hypothetical protein
LWGVVTAPCGSTEAWAQTWEWHPQTHRWTFKTSSGDEMCLTVAEDTPPGNSEVWAGPLENGDLVVLAINRGAGAANITLTWADIGLSKKQPVLVRDLWQHLDVGEFVGAFEAPNVASHGSAAFRFTPL